MKKEVFGQIAHYVKSPLVTIHSLSYILQKKAQRAKIAALASSLSQIQEKIVLQHTRLELLLMYVAVKEEAVDFLYSLFSLRTLEAINGENHKGNVIPEKDILGDKKHLGMALGFLLDKKKKFSITVNVKNVSIVSAIGRKDEEKDENKKTEAYLKRAIAEGVIRLHGGMVVEERNALRITIPLRAKKM